MVRISFNVIESSSFENAVISRILEILIQYLLFSFNILFLKLYHKI